MLGPINQKFPLSNRSRTLFVSLFILLIQKQVDSGGDPYPSIHTGLKVTKVTIFQLFRHEDHKFQFRFVIRGLFWILRMCVKNYKAAQLIAESKQSTHVSQIKFFCTNKE